MSVMLRSCLVAFMLSWKIKIVHASWHRDKTWPTGSLAPSSDDVLAVDELEAVSGLMPSHIPLTGQSSGATTPWLVIDTTEVKLDDDDNAGIPAH